VMRLGLQLNELLNFINFSLIIPLFHGMIFFAAFCLHLLLLF